MSVEIFELISNIAFFIAAIMLILSVILFVRFSIPEVYADLSGKAARREIEDISEKNAQERGKSRKLNPFQYQKGKTSEVKPFTGKMKKSRTPIIQPEISNETEVLDMSSYPQETVLNVDKSSSNDFIVEDNIVFIHTDEIIL